MMHGTCRTLALMLGMLASSSVAASGTQHGSQSAAIPSEVKAGAAEEDNGIVTISLPNLPVIIELRTLYALQDLAASGNSDSVRLQSALLARLDRQLMISVDVADPNLLAHGVAGFVLSGGNPGAAERLSAHPALSVQNRQLLTGAAHFMRGQRKEARVLFAQLDILRLPPTIAARVALAAAIATDKDQESRQKLFAIALATMPGGLVEESALRRSALAYASSGDQVRFWSRVFRYQRRFAKSLYAEEFFGMVIAAALQFEDGAGKLDREMTDLFFKSIPLPRRRMLYLHLARLAAQKNHQDLVAFAASRLRRLAVLGSQEDQLGRLYLALFKVASEASTQATGQLLELNRGLLPDHERFLLDAALTVGREVQQPLQSPEASVSEEDRQEVGELWTTSEAAVRKAEKTIAGALQ